MNPNTKKPFTKKQVFPKTAIKATNKLIKQCEALNVSFDKTTKVSKKGNVKGKDDILKHKEYLLDPIKSTLASQPGSIASAIKPLAIKTLTNALRLRICNKKLNNGLLHPNSLIPSGADFKYKLTCQLEYRETKEFRDLLNECDDAKKEYHDKLKEIIKKRNIMEKNGAKNKLQEHFFNNLIKFYSLYNVFVQNSDDEIKKLDIKISAYALKIL